jgi:hypothetical protein
MDTAVTPVEVAEANDMTTAARLAN